MLSTMSNRMKTREERIEEIREKEDPGFIAPDKSFEGKKKSKVSLWLYFGVGTLIILLIVWLTIAMFTGDTDVNADFIAPFI